jgi:hypothetical protein
MVDRGGSQHRECLDHAHFSLFDARGAPESPARGWQTAILGGRWGLSRTAQRKARCGMRWLTIGQRSSRRPFPMALCSMRLRYGGDTGHAEGTLCSLWVHPQSNGGE